MNARLESQPFAILRPLAGLPVFVATGRDTIAIRPGTTINKDGRFDVGFEKELAVEIVDLIPGGDYEIRLTPAGYPVAALAAALPKPDAIGGFHFAPGGNAAARHGGDDTPAINPCSIWDVGFRPACADPRGMALVERDGLRFWCDIYKLGVDHVAKGTSRHGETIADGRDAPATLDGKERFARLDHPTAVTVYGHHGKQLLSYDEFRAAAFGVTEKSSAPRDPKITGLDTAHTSRFGVMQATGNLWDWGHDGDLDAPRPSLFGGSWINGDAGSRCARLGSWPDYSSGGLSARGRSDHLTLD